MWSCLCTQLSHLGAVGITGVSGDRCTILGFVPGRVVTACPGWVLNVSTPVMFNIIEERWKHVFIFYHFSSLVLLVGRRIDTGHQRPWYSAPERSSIVITQDTLSLLLSILYTNGIFYNCIIIGYLYVFKMLLLPMKVVSIYLIFPCLLHVK